ncbi:hypothetical protein HK104_003402 [Borealophlyctis nickersoniae]|nr:hypothetical protein HK104_003402 [Borealophlyctis nickersoniae]
MIRRTARRDSGFSPDTFARNVVPPTGNFQKSFAYCTRGPTWTLRGILRSCNGMLVWGVVLGVAALHGYPEVVEAVLRRGAKHGTVIAHRLARKGGHPAIVLRLLGLLESQARDASDPKVFVEVVMGAGARACYEHVVRAFLEYKPGPRAVGHALVQAAREGREKMVRLLLEECSKHILNAEEWVDDVPTIIRESGLTLRDRFASGGHTKVVDLLLDHVSLNINDRRPLLAASNNGYVEIVKLLLEKRDNMTTHVRQALRVAGNRKVAEVLRKRLRLEGM